MGSTLSFEAPGDFPTTGQPLALTVQCSHTGQGICFADHMGQQVTGDWTVGHLHRVLESLTGVHRQCQRLMFGGRCLEANGTIQSAISRGEALPSRLKLFMLVDRESFPQRLGPFAPVPVPVVAEDFVLPEVTDELQRCGFYWEMGAGALARHGLRARADRVFGQVSPLHPITADLAQREDFGVPKDARLLAWSYPVADWESLESDAYLLESWDSGITDSDSLLKSFLSIGGFLYFDAGCRVTAATTVGRVPTGCEGGLTFSEPKRWEREWTAALAEQGRFQAITMKSLKDAGVKMYLWLRPNEVIEASDGNPLPRQPAVPHGGFVYLFHEDLLATAWAEVALDRYFAVAPQPKLAASSPPGGPRSPAPCRGDELPAPGTPPRVFRSLTVAIKRAQPGGEDDAPDAEDEDGRLATFRMSPVPTPKGRSDALADIFDE